MLVDLVRTTTSDGHKLDGSLLAPREGTPPRFAVDAFLLLHGVGGNFYAGNLFEHLSLRFADAGIAALRVNTRGHDTISISWGSLGPIRHGAAYEEVDLCRHDVAAWTTFLQQRGFQRIGIVGHSLGAIKAIYSQAFAPLEAVCCVAALSAPRLSYSAFMNSEAQPRFFETYFTARDFVEQGQPDALVNAKFPFPVLITAKGYLDKYGPDERYNIVRFVDRLTCPLLATYGALELENGGIAFAGVPKAIVERRREGQSVVVEEIAGADHAYSGVYARLSECLEKWLAATIGFSGD